MIRGSSNNPITRAIPSRTESSKNKASKKDVSSDSSSRAPTSARAGVATQSSRMMQMSAGPNVRIAMPVPGALPKKTEGLNQRIAFVQNSVAASQALFQKAEAIGGPKQKIYMGPEYMFDNETRSQGKANHKNNDTIRQLTEQQYRHVDTAMRALSKQYPDIVIKPGTTAWQKPVERPTTLNDYLASKGATDPAHPRHAELTEKFSNKNLTNDPNDPQYRLNKAIDANKAAQQAYGLHNIPDVEKDVTHLARNTADTYLNGERISHHHKITNFNEVNYTRSGEKVQHYAGRDPLGSHTLGDGTTATQEICLDHAIDVAKHAGTAHFIHSDWTTPNHSLDKYNRGTEFVAHASTYKDVKQIKVQDAARVERNGNLTSLNPVDEHSGVSLYDLQTSPVDSITALKPKISNTNFDDLLKGMDYNENNHAQQKDDKGCVVS